ncbi:MAG: oxidoreductase [Bacteroidetes bacterium RIFOXYA12_FULL_35_11]|nr:MAG: oxidoreductase [Bacteroidetes bacterium GWF2_35_48]OFY76797.1 MAG: oxidoreductase [Bacteroidetes bacterium RIFOXYA12_FULL_35_11]OFY98025.1 MAG: oxidoreductase [Bacteroidetes bacterium RIFOXYC12_FULL_35_7]HBX49836.1 oxidoreductase [Bacteroidales bacterium]
MIKFALIGCGRIAPKHVECLKKLDNAEIIAVCDIDKEKAEKYSKNLNVPFYTDYREMLTKENADVISILTPSGLHWEMAIDAMNHGKHVVVEKPMALKIHHADMMIEAADNNGVRLFVVKQNRFNSSVVKAREALDTGRLGKLVLGTVRVRWSRDQSYYNLDGWRGTWALDGGVLTNQASHHIDLLQWFFGNVESVMAMTTTALVNIETEDTGVAILKFTNGALGIIEATTATRPKDLEGSLSILGEKGSIVIGGFAVNKIQTWEFSESIPEDIEIKEKYKENPPNVYGFGHEPYLRHVIDSLDSGKSALVDGMAGRKSLEIINAIYESAVTGKRVFIHNQFSNSPLGE